MNDAQFKVMQRQLRQLHRSFKPDVFLEKLASFSKQANIKHLKEFLDNIFRIFHSYFHVTADDPEDIWVKALNHLIQTLKSEVLPEENIFDHRGFYAWLIDDRDYLWHLSRGELDAILQVRDHALFNKKVISKHIEFYKALIKIIWPYAIKFVCQRIFDFLSLQEKNLIIDLESVGIKQPVEQRVRFNSQTDIRCDIETGIPATEMPESESYVEKTTQKELTYSSFATDNAQAGETKKNSRNKDGNDIGSRKEALHFSIRRLATKSKFCERKKGEKK